MFYIDGAFFNDFYGDRPYYRDCRYAAAGDIGVGSQRDSHGDLPGSRHAIDPVVVTPPSVVSGPMAFGRVDVVSDRVEEGSSTTIPASPPRSSSPPSTMVQPHAFTNWGNEGSTSTFSSPLPRSSTSVLPVAKMPHHVLSQNAHLRSNNRRSGVVVAMPWLRMGLESRTRT
jgi:hypothetical protein